MASTATAHKDAWANDPIWQGVRENVERLTAIRDWAEAFFAATVVFEPLVGELFRSEFVMQVAAPQGDFVTPTLMGAGESDVARDARVVADALFGMLSNDEKHGEENRATMQSWLDDVDADQHRGRAARCSRSGHSRARR